MKFTIRDLFLVTVIVALAVGWWLERTSLAEKTRKLAETEWKLKTLSQNIEKHTGYRVIDSEWEIGLEGNLDAKKGLDVPMSERPTTSLPVSNPPKP